MHKDETLMERWGYQILCESPLEIESKRQEESLATGQAARDLIDYHKLLEKQGITPDNEDDIPIPATVWQKNKYVNIIGITFNDIDFCKTFEGFLIGINEACKINPIFRKNITKERIVALANATMNSIYWMFQNGYDYDLNNDMTEYLTLSSDNILFDDEVMSIIDGEKQSMFGNLHYLIIDQDQISSM